MNEDASYYAIIPANVRYDDDIPPNAKLLYGEITALCNTKGYCWASNSYFAKLYHTSTRSVSRWISALVDKGYLKVDMKYSDDKKIIEERHITIVPNAESTENLYRQNCLYPIDKIVYTPTTKLSRGIDKNVQENNTLNNTVNNTLNNIMSDFDKLWELYPRKEGKKAALEAYKRAIKKGVTNEEIEKGIKSYISKLNADCTEKRFIKKGDTFFRGEHWNDDYEITGVNNGRFNKYGGISAGNTGNAGNIGYDDTFV